MEFMFLYMKGFFQAGTNTKFNLSVKRNWITFSHFATAPFGHTEIWPRVQTVSERWKKECHLAGLVDLCSGKESLKTEKTFFPNAQKGEVTCMVLGSFKLWYQFSKDIHKEVLAPTPYTMKNKMKWKRDPTGFFWGLFQDSLSLQSECNKRVNCV